jgi:hypothetical protein
MERRTKAQALGRTGSDSNPGLAKDANGKFKTLQSVTKLQDESEISASELESVVGGTGGAGAGKVTFNPFQITRKLT